MAAITPALQGNPLVGATSTEPKGTPLPTSTEPTHSFVVSRIKEIPAPRPEKEGQIEKKGQIEKMLEDTTTSIVDKIKSLIPIPESIVYLIDLFATKKANYKLQAEIADDTLTLTTAVEIPGQQIKGTASLQFPLTQTTVSDPMVELHPALVNFLSQAVASSQPDQTQEIVKLLSTLPSKYINFYWSKGSATITITLPAGVILKLKLTIPSSEITGAPDFLRAFLKSILKESYAGIESLLSQEFVFKFDGSTSRFDLQFTQQLALHIHELTLDSSALLSFFGKDMIVVIPKTISGIINFKEPSIQFDCSSPFKVKKKVVLFDATKEFSLTKIAFNAEENKIALAFEGLPDITIDLNKPAEEKTTPAGKNIVDFEFLPYTPRNPQPKKAATVPVIDTIVKPKISVFETIKKMIPIPPVFLPLIGNLFENQTKLDVNLKVEDNITLSTDVTLPNLGIGGKVHLSIPTKMSSAESAPVKLHPEFDSILSTLLADKVEPKSSELLMFVNSLVDLALTLPNQHIHFNWRGGVAEFVMTLPGGITVGLELDIQQKSAEKDTLRTKLFEVLDSGLTEPFALFTSLQDILNTVGKDDFRRAELLQILRKEGDKNKLRAQFLKVLQKDLLRIRLAEMLGEKFASIEPLLGQTFTFNWDGSTKQFSFTFSEQQQINIEALNLKKDTVLFAIVSGLVSWISTNGVITIPKTIKGNFDFEKVSVSFQKGTTFTILGPLYTYKNVSLRQLSFGEKNKVGVKLICFGPRDLTIDTTTSNVDSAAMTILSRERPQGTQ